jgi:dolichyl-phosphate-mannose-protein mannosyltransferase
MPSKERTILPQETPTLLDALAVRRRTILILIALVLLASAGLRLWQLGKPTDFIFDEIYYAKDAVAILHGKLGPSLGALAWEPGKEISWPHPEMGKLAIAGGIAVFGDNPFGRRIVAALAGLALLACIYPIGRRLGLSQWWALGALILAAADPLGLAQSRIATLDIFVGLWTVLCVYLTLRYVQDGHRARWLWLAGLAGGMAAGTKWSGALACIAALGLIVLFRRRDEGAPASPAAGLGRAALRALPPLAAFVALPIAVYVSSYTLYFVAGHSWSQWWEMQHQMWGFNFGLKAKHTYASKAYTWILDERPVWYYFKERAGKFYGVVSIGNPLLWWASIAALAGLVVTAVGRRQWLPAVPALLVAVLYLPWFLASRTSFMYYMTPVAPFLAIVVAAMLAVLARDYRGAPSGWTWSATPQSVATSAVATPDDLSLAAPSYPLPTDAPAAPAAPSSLAADMPTAPIERFSLAAALPPTRSAALATVEDRPLLRPALLFAAGVVFTTFLWHQIATVAVAVFWRGPSHVSHRLSYILIALAIGVGAGLLVGLTLSAYRRSTWQAVAWAYVGIVVGIFVIFLPVIVNIGITPAHYYRLMWFQRWI